MGRPHAGPHIAVMTDNQSRWNGTVGQLPRYAMRFQWRGSSMATAQLAIAVGADGPLPQPTTVRPFYFRPEAIRQCQGASTGAGDTTVLAASAAYRRLSNLKWSVAAFANPWDARFGRREPWFYPGALQVPRHATERHAECMCNVTARPAFLAVQPNDFRAQFGAWSMSAFRHSVAGRRAIATRRYAQLRRLDVECLAACLTDALNQCAHSVIIPATRRVVMGAIG
jgi:hypothetical protein